MIKPKKHLGQHFLRDQNIAGKIAGSLEVPAQCRVYEIGPGTGILTAYLVERFPGRLGLFEIDREVIPILKERFPQLEESIVHADFLRVKAADYFTGTTALIGNLPYNISSQILFRVLENRSSVVQVVCMLQKEVAERIISPPGNKDYGILSVLLQSYYKAEYLFTVGELVFFPPPKVKSAVIRLSRNDREDTDEEYRMLLHIVKTSFNQRRKTLHNSLGRGMPQLELDANTAGKRAEELSVDDFKTLVQKALGRR